MSKHPNKTRMLIRSAQYLGRVLVQDPLARSARRPYEPKPTINVWVIVGVIVGVKIIINIIILFNSNNHPNNHPTVYCGFRFIRLPR